MLATIQNLSLYKEQLLHRGGGVLLDWFYESSPNKSSNKLNELVLHLKLK